MKKGFTLIELLVVVFILITLTTIFISNYRTGEKTISLQREGIKLFQNIRRVQTMLGLDYSSCTSEDYDYAYGLFFDKTKAKEYYFFADCKAKRKYDNTSEIIETVELEKDIKLNIDNNISVVFVLPKPEIYLMDGTKKVNSIELVFQIEDEGKQKTIKINKLGLVQYE